MDNRVNGLPDSRIPPYPSSEASVSTIIQVQQLGKEYDFPWFNQENDGSSSEGLKGRILPPKKRFRINSSLMAWKPDPRQQLILDNLWSSIKDPQKGEETINALVLHMEEQSNSKASLQKELCQKIDSLQTELSLQKAQTQAFLQNRCTPVRAPIPFGNNAWDLITKSLRCSASLSIHIESSPSEWISPTQVQPAIHYVFISPIDSKVILPPEARYWTSEDQVIIQISKWRAWVQENKWHWRKYPEHIPQFSGYAPLQRNLRKRLTTTPVVPLRTKNLSASVPDIKQQFVTICDKKGTGATVIPLRLNSTPHVSALSKVAQRQGIHHCL
ncbi:hypothetical protein CRG98_004436 [Punica granatum]|uniref:Uncharacterized protein n=1 Tax=Punica granatum TaxID=22663 RepID=A0A2I0L316_PUNGR|nr:hypothetical protein CRG98_004436 [Punica granatum]